ncbi:MAG: hypothetical protein JSV30_05580 [Candidatus Omnitrophota bacterium]|nr:MAG: hypothetical protein JSV30_05580 [Candidatus Omnitrophota bacterium]
MKNLLFEQIDKSKFMRNGKLNLFQIEHASPIDIIDFSKQSLELTSVKKLPREESVFSHSASFSLGGSRWPCVVFDCRMAYVKQLAQFAAFYSDKVYIRNFLADHVEHSNKKNLSDVRKFQKDFAEDLLILNYLRPLIKAEKIVPITAPYFCTHCLAKHSLGQKDDRRLKKALTKLIDRFNNQIKASVRMEKGLYVVDAHGPEILLEHGATVNVAEKMPVPLKKIPHIIAKIKKGKEIHLSRTALKKIGYAEYLAKKNYENINFELATAQCLNTSFLTERILHIDFLREISLDPNIEQRNQIIQKYMTCLVPFIEDIDPLEILKLRAGEEESFILFRNVLNKAINEYRKSGKNFSKRDAQAIFQDIIRPKLSLLDTRIKSAQRSLIKGVRREIIAWTGAISFGMYSGLLPDGLIAAASALGLVKIIAELTKRTMAKSDLEETIRSQDLYFLWKVRQRQKS